MASARSLTAELIVHPSSEDRADGGGAPPPRPWTGPRPQDAGAPVDGPSGSDLTTASPTLMKKEKNKAWPTKQPRAFRANNAHVFTRTKGPNVV